MYLYFATNVSNNYNTYILELSQTVVAKQAQVVRRKRQVVLGSAEEAVKLFKRKSRRPNERKSK
jgi:hypothetical protein